MNDARPRPRDVAQTTLPLPDPPPSEVVSATLPRHERIYVNRSLRFEQVELVGFDMDYTLAIYDQPEIDRLSIEWTVRKLVEERGYPAMLGGLTYRTDFPVRGLQVDRKLGHVVKMDRYRYVTRGYHGHRELTKEERRALYHSRRLRGLSGRFHWVDTLYALPEVAVYAGAIEALEKAGYEVDADRLFADIRECIDIAHRDQSIPNAVLADLPRYVIRDPDLAPTLHKLRSAGKRLFLLTNSAWPYTDRMMGYLLSGAMPEYPSWRHYFDLVVVSSGKPGFFTEKRPFREIVGDARRPVGSLERGRIYEGGCIQDLERMLGARGDGVLYVGDHIYGDVLRAKKETAWRTALILQEMVAEVDALDRTAEDRRKRHELEQRLARVDEELRFHVAKLKETERRLEETKAALRAEKESGSVERSDVANESRVALEATRRRERRAIDQLRAAATRIDEEHRALRRHIANQFHPYWGSLFSAGQETSSFGHQIEEYACLYTARVSNFLRYSPLHYFRSPRALMPHET
ncbi:MAG: HAD-IG family 5'-nucleotidase [Deltaproteobacteria bacterium]|nr:HAD-IG family 5'-nucleotidase [Deltaproteobacteria bacterium]